MMARFDFNLRTRVVQDGDFWVACNRLWHMSKMGMEKVK